MGKADASANRQHSKSDWLCLMQLCQEYLQCMAGALLQQTLLEQSSCIPLFADWAQGFTKQILVSWWPPFKVSTQV